MADGYDPDIAHSIAKKNGMKWFFNALTGLFVKTKEYTPSSSDSDSDSDSDYNSYTPEPEPIFNTPTTIDVTPHDVTYE